MTCMGTRLVYECMEGMEEDGMIFLQQVNLHSFAAMEDVSIIDIILMNLHILESD